MPTKTYTIIAITMSLNLEGSLGITNLKKWVKIEGAMSSWVDPPYGMSLDFFLIGKPPFLGDNSLRSMIYVIQGPRQNI